MVGHAMVAFALVAFGARTLGFERDRALALGVIAGAFATVPDVDITYAVVGAARAQLFDVWALTDAFWRSSQVVHRSITHSLIVAVPAALAFALSTVDDGTWTIDLPGRNRSLALAPLVGGVVLFGLVAVAMGESGPLGGTIMLVFALAGLAVATLGRRVYGLSSRAVFVTALFGLASHPFGDLFTGSPPAFLYPFDATLVAHRLTLATDPTLNLLAIFGVELATLWLAASVYLTLTERRLPNHVNPRAALGVAYAVAAFVLPAPTLSVSYQFVFSVLAVGVVGVTPRSVPRPEWEFPTPTVSRPSRDNVLTAALTALTAVTLAATAYTAVYLTQPFLTQPFLG